MGQYPEIGVDKFKAEWRQNLPADQYHAMKTHISASGISELLNSAMHFQHRFILGKSPDATPSMKLGNLIHAAILEPERFMKHMVMEPDFTGTGSRAKLENWRVNQGPDAIILDEKQFEITRGILDSIRSHDIAMKLIAGGHKEISGFWQCEKTKVSCRIRPDILRQDKKCIIDLKTTSDASRNAFSRSCFNYRYHISAAFYLDGASQIDDAQYEEYIFLAVETSKPYAVAAYVADMAMVEKGRHDYLRALEFYKECKEKNQFPGYQNGICENIGLPMFAFYD